MTFRLKGSGADPFAGAAVIGGPSVANRMPSYSFRRFTCRHQEP